ncbi:MAG TPA: hypothetical protein VN426_13085 [Syntrophomonadaceae bacterium]|nr:hypothetical protein [Syntrophomonadaceae bacterium]
MRLKKGQRFDIVLLIRTALSAFLKSKTGWTRWLLPIALVATTAFELYIRCLYQKQLGVGSLIGISVAGIYMPLLLCLAAKKKKIAAAASLAGILVLLAEYANTLHQINY